MIAAAHDRIGRRIARLFRTTRGLSRDTRACDLDAILSADSIDVQESWCSDPGYTACLVRVDEGIPPGILLAGGQSRGRARFSLAHELGHLYIPTHSDRPSAWCNERAMVAGANVGDQLEWEANDFAAELLMPQHLFTRDAKLLPPSFASVAQLASAGQYDVSVTAAAIRYLQVTRAACALISSQAGVIDWVIKSEPFLYRIPWRGDRVPPSSVAASGKAVSEPEQLAPEVWLEVAQRPPVELFESTHCVPTQRQTLSFLWVEEGSEWE